MSELETSKVYEQASLEVRKHIAEDLEILKEACIANEVPKNFIHGLDTARDLVTGSITLHPTAYQDSSFPPPLF
jgi:hypothetical protein